jgi:pimeloyl-ACP methyl ester carboxylesterase
MPTLQLPDVDLHYVLEGSGPRLLFFNGSGSSIAEMSLLIEILAARFEVLVHDQRGLGLTGVPRGLAPTMADYASDGVALLDHLGWERTAVLGLSFGGMVAQELAVTHPDRLERLALLCTSSGGAGGSSYPLHELAMMAPEERRRTEVAIADTRFDEAWLAAHPSDRALADHMAGRGDRVVAEARRRGEVLQLEARRLHDVYDRLGAISCPTLVAAGRYDGTAPLQNSQAIVDAIPGARLEVYEGGHMFLLQDARAITDIMDFLAAVD